MFGFNPTALRPILPSKSAQASRKPVSFQSLLASAGSWSDMRSLVRSASPRFGAVGGFSLIGDAGAVKNESQVLRVDFEKKSSMTAMPGAIRVRM